MQVVRAGGYENDVRTFASWGRAIADAGLAHLYDPGRFIDYPPALMYLLWPLAAIFDGEALRLAVKSLSIPFDVAIALLAATLAWRAAGPGRAVLAAALWSFAPGAIMAGPYWGQIDAVGTLVVFVALLVAGARRWLIAGALAGIATVLKFQLGVVLLVIVVAAAVEAYRARTPRPLVAFVSAPAAALIVSSPFGLGVPQLFSLLRFAGDEYRYTSLFAFNIWAIFVGFWQPDAPYVALGGLLLVVGLAGACLPLWRRRDTTTLLGAGALAALAFYFLPTRAHERYLFPALALLLPFAATRGRLLVPYVVLSVAFAYSLYFALTHTLGNDVVAPRWVDAVFFNRPMEVAIALLMTGSAGACVALIVPMAIRWPSRRVVLGAVLAVPMAFNAVTLLPEITTAVPSNNDDANHFAYVQRADEALGHGENPFDFWAPEMEFGFPPFVYYQHLPHLAVVALARATFGVIDLFTLFNLVRWLLLVLLPLTVAWSLRRMGFPAPAAVFAGAAAGLLSADGRFGLEYDSFIWRGWGMYTQLWAAHLTFLSLAAVTDLLHRGRGLLFAIVALAALALSHLIWAYMTAITTLVVLLVGITRSNARARVVRLAIVGAAVALITSYMWLPFLQSKAFLNVSQPYLPRWRFDSFGIGPILSWLTSGELLDHGRIPVLTLLLAIGIGVAIRRRDRLATLALALLSVWLVLWSGRTTLGPLADLLPLGAGLHVHRFVGGVDVAAILLIGVAAAACWQLARADASPRRAALVGAAAILLLVPAMAERASYYAFNTTWMEQTRAAIQSDDGANALAAVLERTPLERTYVGAANDWEKWLGFVPFNSAKFADVLNLDRVTRVARPYASLSLNADLAFHFNDQDPVMYDLFDARYAVAALAQPVPSFLRPVATYGRWRLLEASTSGLTTFAATTTRESASTDETLFFRMRDWLTSDAPRAKRFIRFDYPATGAAGPEQAWCANGRVSYQRAQRDSLDTIAACDGPFALVMKITYHPNWLVTIDDRPAESFMVSPGFIGVEVPAGSHFVSARYVSTPLKTPLLIVGGLTVGALFMMRRRLDALLR